MSDEILIQAQGLSMRYGSKLAVRDLNFFYGGFHALKHINLEVPERKVTAFIGPSGCGKSTFLRTLNRMNDIVPGARVEGKVLVDGEDLYGAGTDIVSLRRKVGMVFQKSNPFPKSIFENVAYGLRINGMAKGKALDRKSTRLNSSHSQQSRMPSSA